jgi:hypothetical protein
MSLPPNSDKKSLLNNIVVENDYPEFPNVSSGPGGSGSGSPLTSVEDKYHMDEIIPSSHSNRTIILCFDGTGDQFDEDVRFFHFLKKNPPSLLVLIFQELQYRSVLLHAEEGQ